MTGQAIAFLWGGGAALGVFVLGQITVRILSRYL